MEIITKMHIHLNGRICEISAYDQREQPKILPSDPGEKAVFNLFKISIEKKGDFNPWKPVVFREIQIAKILSETPDAGSMAIVLFKLLEDMWILQVKDGFTLYSPIHYYWIKGENKETTSFPKEIRSRECSGSLIYAKEMMLGN